MANHKRRRAKHQRSGCLMCKPHKDERLGKRRTNATMQEKRAREADSYERMMQRSHVYLDAMLPSKRAGGY